MLDEDLARAARAAIALASEAWPEHASRLYAAEHIIVSQEVELAGGSALASTVPFGAGAPR